MSGFDSVQALVLSARTWSESSRIITAVAAESGKFRAVCRGAQKLQGGVAAALEPITLSSLILQQSRRGGMPHVATAEASEYFWSLKRSLVAISLASGLCELCEVAMPEDEPNPVLFGRLCGALRRMEDAIAHSTARERALVNLFWRAAVDIAGDLGYGLQLRACVNCSSETKSMKGFCLSEGGPVCIDCAPANTVSWNPVTGEKLRWLAEAGENELLGWILDKEQNREIRSLMERFFRFHVPGFDRLRSLDTLTVSSAKTPASESGK